MRLSNFRIPFAVIGLTIMSSVSMTMPVQAINRIDCGLRGDYLKIIQGNSVMCFANAGGLDVHIADVHRLTSGNNAGYVKTNKGIYSFEKGDKVEFRHTVGTVTIEDIFIK
jgi:hypothetical protein